MDYNFLKKYNEFTSQFLVSNVASAYHKQVLPPRQARRISDKGTMEATYHYRTGHFHFSAVTIPGFEHLLGVSAKIRIDTLVLKTDDKFFMKALYFGMAQLKEYNRHTVRPYALVFECRLNNKAGLPCRMMLRWQLIADDTPDTLCLHLKFTAINGIADAVPTRGLYIVNIDTSTVAKFRKGAGLTPMQQQVAQLLCKGYSYTEIGRLLYLSPETIKTHRKAIYQQLGIKNHLQLLFYFYSMGLADIP